MTTPVPDPRFITDPKFIPDPTKLTRDEINAAAEHARRELDAATEQLGTRIDCLRELMEGKFDAIERRFRDRDARALDIQTANEKAIAAALASQKELAQQQDTTNRNAIDKNEELTEKGFEGLKTQVDDLKSRVGRMESLREGSARLMTQQLAVTTVVITIIVVVVNIIIAYVTSH
jgi:hypothetical protein